MTTEQLAAFLEGSSVGRIDLADLLTLAAQRLRELEAVRSHAARLVALEESVRASDVSVAWRDLRAALAGVGQ